MMKYLSKRRVAGVLLCGLLAFSMAGCGKETLDNTVNDKNSEQETDAWMETENEKDVLDVDSMKDDQTDYSKYEEKKAEREASGNSNGNVTYSDGSSSGQDEFQTDPVPEGMQNPVNPGDVDVDTSQEQYCYMTISCATILNNMGELT